MMWRYLESLAGTALAVILIALAAPVVEAEPARAIPDIDYNADKAGPREASHNQLDLYLPATSGNRQKRELRPLVVWVHGGALMKGDKSNRMGDKVRLFNELGYIVASVNYRLSPDISGGACCEFDPLRVRAPDHVSDLAEALGWLSRRVASYHGDPDSIVLIGHSAGAQLVSLAATSPFWVRGRQVSPKQLLGAVSLDTDSFDVRAEAAESSPLQARMLAWNAFGTPEEEAIEARWDEMSPIRHADPSDPAFLFVTQNKPGRLAANRKMAEKLGQAASESVVAVPYDHEEINTKLGAPDDNSVETARVGEFVQRVVASAQGVGVRITGRPAKKVVVKVKGSVGKSAIRKLRRKISFTFQGTGRTSGFQCRIDRKNFKSCRGSKSYRLKPGKHTFRIRPLYPSGRPGDERKVTFRIVTRRSRH